MKMKKIAMFSLLALIVISVFAAGVFAYGFDGVKRDKIDMTDEERDDWFEEREERRAEMEERRELIDAAIEDGDFDAWMLLMKEINHPMSEQLIEKITEDNFETYILMHNARINGDFETANEYALELGLQRPSSGIENGRGPGNGRARGGFGGHGFRGTGNCFKASE